MTRAPSIALLLAALLSGLANLSALHPAAAKPMAGPPAAAPAAPLPRVYLFRGFVGVVFSRGTDTLAARIEQAGFSATVNEAVMCPIVAKEAIADYRTRPAPIVAIGHSLGATCTLLFAQLLDSEHIPVSLIVTTDPPRAIDDVVPLNVARYINVFQSNSVLGGKDVVAAKGYQGHYASYDLAEHKEISHLNIEKIETLQDQVLGKIRQLAVTPAKVDGEPLPLRYVVPADAEIQLWDSGMAVAAQRGDTLEKLAARYGVPVWSLSQVNKVSDSASLTPGQRIVVPRRLPPVAATGEDSGGRQTPPKPH